MLYLAIPALNEADTIGVLLWRLRSVLAEFPREYEVVVYDDASSDVTSEVLEPYTKVLPLTVLRGERTVGYAGAVDALVRYVSRQTRYPRRDAMLLLQGDFTDPPALVPEFAKRFEGGADMVIGERSQSVDTPVSVRRLLRVTPWVTRPFVRVEGVRDITSSFRLVRISVLRDLIRAAGDAPVCVGDELTANADFLLRTVPLARRVETLPVEPTFGVRTRETRRITMRDGMALARWAWRARGRRVAPSTAPESPADNARPPRDSKGDTRNDFRSDSRAEVRSESRPEFRIEAKHEPRLETRTSSRGEARPNPRNDARREARNDARKKERPEPRSDAPREYGNDALYDLAAESRSAESRSAAASSPRESADAIESESTASPEERRPKRPRPKRRKRGGRKTLDANGNPIPRDIENAGVTQSSQSDDVDASEDLVASASDESGEEGASELSEVDHAKRSPRKKRRKRGSRRNRSAEGAIVEGSDSPDVSEGEAPRGGSARNDGDDGDDASSDDSSDNDDSATEGDNAGENAGAPRARRRGRRGRRGGARRSRSAAAEGTTSNESGDDNSAPSQNGAEPSGDNAST